MTKKILFYALAALALLAATGCNKDSKGGKADEDKTSIKQGRWDVYKADNDTQLEYALVFSDGRYVEQYAFMDGTRIKGEYTFENGRLTIIPTDWYIAPGNYKDTENYGWINPDTLEPINTGDWNFLDNGTIDWLRTNAEWWFDREFILDSSTTAHGEDLIYKYKK